MTGIANRKSASGRKGVGAIDVPVNNAVFFGNKREKVRGFPRPTVKSFRVQSGFFAITGGPDAIRSVPKTLEAKGTPIAIA